MADDNSFADFIQRIRAGDGQAAADLVKQYEAAIRMEVRFRLRDPRLHRIFDSMDICQSVLASFFVRAAAGQYDLDQPDQLLKLLVAIARNKVAFQARKQRTQRRDNRRVEGLNAGQEAVSGQPSPSRIVAGKELLEEFRKRLSEEERQLADRRAHGLPWAEIAEELGGTPHARCKQLARAVERVTRELGLDDLDNDKPIRRTDRS